MINRYVAIIKELRLKSASFYECLSKEGMKSATGKHEWSDIKVIYILIEDVIKTKQNTIKLKN